ncbi:hypothetical protein [Paraburkholderia hospita]|uniref:hypothetical protein n=1 Tax=Paraburkholderia hospita TaxID=169430 RepID=UPI000B344EB2|nr:hypothetical protein [Paraburkholderia hospita]OUL84875.1 hypothetical protein CA603_24300 [Paraburkholderia hospita]
MTSMHQANIVLPEGAVTPDEWNDGLRVRLPREFVISRRRNGDVASKRGDLFWDWSGYDPRGRAVGLSFAFWTTRSGKSQLKDIPPQRQTFVDDMQHLMSLVIYKRHGPTLAFNTLHSYLKVFCAIAQYCEKQTLSIPTLLTDEQHFSAYVATVGHRTVLQTLFVVVSFLMTLDPEHDIGYPVAGNAVIAELRRRYREYAAMDKQTPPIPTRIYSEIISAVAAQLKDFAEVADRFLALAAEVLSNTAARQADERHTWTPVLVTKHGLDSYFESKGLAKSAKGISRGLTEAQLLCKLTIHIFSGMRDEEAQALRFHCTETEQDHGRTHYLLCGQTTKFNHGKIRRTKWVTNSEAYEAVLLAQRIATLIYGSMGCIPEQSKEMLSRYPLFVSTGYLALNGRPPRGADAFQVQRLRITRRDETLVEAAIRPLIQECDLRELEEIDPHRAWRSEEKFQIGMPWPLRTHQFRRSLVIYAQRSGMVSLPSLRRQLQHITKEMSLYYAKGSAFARNFIEDDPDDYKLHMAKEWRDAKPLSEALAYLRDVLLTEEELFGGAGTFEQQKKNRGILMSRDTTIRKFKRGEMAYKETPIGGCIKVGECDQVGLKVLETECILGCKNLVGKLPKLDRLIDRQSKFVSTLDPTTVEYRMEQSDLNVLIDARSKWQAASERRSNGKRAD